MRKAARPHPANKKYRALKKSESAYKPGSVEDSHSSGICVTADLKRPTRIHRGPRHWIPIWPCSGRGLPSPWTVASHAVRSYRTFSPLPATLARCLGGVLSVALSVGSRLPGVTWRHALWSPDFPPLATRRTPKRSEETYKQRLSGRLARQVSDSTWVTQETFFGCSEYAPRWFALIWLASSIWPPHYNAHQRLNCPAFSLFYWPNHYRPRCRVFRTLSIEFLPIQRLLIQIIFLEPGNFRRKR